MTNITDNVFFIDVDGVLLDYDTAYVNQFNKVFGTSHTVIDKNAYTFFNKFGIPRLDGEDLAKFELSKDDNFWSGMAPVDDALLLLASIKTRLGIPIVALSKSPSEFKFDRLINLRREFGYLIDGCICIGDAPKDLIVNSWAAVKKWIIDDHYDYVQDINTSETTVIVYNRASNAEDNPNTNMPSDICVSNTLIGCLDYV